MSYKEWSDYIYGIQIKSDTAFKKFLDMLLKYDAEHPDKAILSLDPEDEYDAGTIAEYAEGDWGDFFLENDLQLYELSDAIEASLPEDCRGLTYLDQDDEGYFYIGVGVYYPWHAANLPKGLFSQERIKEVLTKLAEDLGVSSKVDEYTAYYSG